MRTRLSLFLLFTVFLLSLNCRLYATIYEVVMLRGQVSYKGTELKKGSRIETSDLDMAANMKREIPNFKFGSSTDEVRLLDKEHRKIVLVSARSSKPGSDLMLATRGMKYFKSDFEFKRAFTPETGTVALLYEDTILCTGLKSYRFNGDVHLQATYQYKGQQINKTIGRNDSLFLTSSQLYKLDTPEGQIRLNSFEIAEIQLSLFNMNTGKTIPFPDSINPVSVLFVDDIIRYLSSVSYEGLAMKEEAIYNFLLPDFIKERQIQRELGLYSEDEARNWLHDHIQSIISNP